jgi:hypothetical protein
MPAPQDPFASAPPPQRRRLAQFRIARAFAVCGAGVFLLGCVVAGAVGGEGGQVAAILGFVFGLTAFIIAGLMQLFSIRWQRAVDAMAQGHHFVHWTYTAEQWEQHLAGETKRMGRLWLILACIMGAGGLLACVIATAEGGMKGEDLAIFWLIFLGGFPIMGAVIGSGLQFAHRRNVDRMRREGGEVFIGAKGVYISGTYWPWSSTGQTLTGSTLQPPASADSPAQLVFNFYINTGKGSYTREVFIPVPPGQEDEALLVLEQVRAGR